MLWKILVYSKVTQLYIYTHTHTHTHTYIYIYVNSFFIIFLLAFFKFYNAVLVSAILVPVRNQTLKQGSMKFSFSRSFNSET